MTNPTNTDLAAALREIADTLPLGSALIVRLAADRLGEHDQGWIEWTPDGSKGPVFAKGTRVEVQLRDGTTDTDFADIWMWDDLDECTIARYRPVITFMR